EQPGTQARTTSLQSSPTLARAPARIRRATAPSSGCRPARPRRALGQAVRVSRSPTTDTRRRSPRWNRRATDRGGEGRHRRCARRRRRNPVRARKTRGSMALRRNRRCLAATRPHRTDLQTNTHTPTRRATSEHQAAVGETSGRIVSTARSRPVRFPKSAAGPTPTLHAVTLPTKGDSHAGRYERALERFLAVLHRRDDEVLVDFLDWLGVCRRQRLRAQAEGER